MAGNGRSCAADLNPCNGSRASSAVWAAGDRDSLRLLSRYHAPVRARHSKTASVQIPRVPGAPSPSERTVHCACQAESEFAACADFRAAGSVGGIRLSDQATRLPRCFNWGYLRPGEVYRSPVYLRISLSGGRIIDACCVVSIDKSVTFSLSGYSKPVADSIA